MQVTLSGIAAVRAVDNVIQLRVTELAAEELPEGAASQIERFAEQLSYDVQLPELPYGLTVESVRPTASGISVSFSAVDVPLSS